MRDGSLLSPYIGNAVDVTLTAADTTLADEPSGSESAIDITQGNPDDIASPGPEERATGVKSLDQYIKQGAFRKYLASFGFTRLVLSFCLLAVKAGIDKGSRKYTTWLNGPARTDCVQRSSSRTGRLGTKWTILVGRMASTWGYTRFSSVLIFCASWELRGPSRPTASANIAHVHHSLLPRVFFVHMIPSSAKSLHQQMLSALVR